MAAGDRCGDRRAVRGRDPAVCRPHRPAPAPLLKRGRCAGRLGWAVVGPDAWSHDCLPARGRVTNGREWAAAEFLGAARFCVRPLGQLLR